MYKKIVLAFDSTVEGRAALREGALLARSCGADVFLLSVMPETFGAAMAESAQAGVGEQLLESYNVVLEEGLRKLQQLGFAATGKLVRGEPAQQVGQYARDVGADLVIVGHRKRNFLERWWSGSNGPYIVDNVGCSLLVARNEISDQAFEDEISRLKSLRPQLEVRL